MILEVCVSDQAVMVSSVPIVIMWSAHFLLLFTSSRATERLCGQWLNSFDRDVNSLVSHGSLGGTVVLEKDLVGLGGSI